MYFNLILKRKNSGDEKKRKRTDNDVDLQEYPANKRQKLSNDE